MSAFAQIINEIKSQMYPHKTQLLEYLLKILQQKKMKCTADDTDALSAFAFSEVEMLIEVIPKEEKYYHKDLLFDYENNLLGLIMALYSSPEKLPKDKFEKVQTLVEVVEKERYLENLIDSLFEQEHIEKPETDALIKTVLRISDEYHRGKLYPGLMHYKDSFTKLSDDSKQLFADYIAAELERYIKEKDNLDNEKFFNLEVSCDICKYFANERIIELLLDVLRLGHNEINFYAIGSLLAVGATIPAATVEMLAKDLLHADRTYHLLKMHNKTELFPKELSDPVYLAKSDLIQWLTYPTELGKEPDEIEYLGKTKVKREIYYIFRFRSDSDTLDDESKNRWLIGWSNEDGGTFSNFDKYSLYEKKTPEKTVKYIKKKLLG